MVCSGDTRRNVPSFLHVSFNRNDIQTGSGIVYEQAMTHFTNMETAALRAIFAETPAISSDLQRQLSRATVTKRENTGGGFYTDIAVPDDVPGVKCPKVLGYATHARVEGLEHGLGFVLFLEDGRLQLLEGYARGPESTTSLDLHSLSFEIYHEPLQRLD